jgi:hypothetical protein
MKNRLRIAASVFFAVLTVALCVVCVAGCTNDNNLVETERRGDIIVGALKKFHADHGHYPAFLNDLSPQYLNEIPPPTWGLETWKYTPNSTDFYFGVDESTSTGDGDSLWFNYLGDVDGWQTGD